MQSQFPKTVHLERLFPVAKSIISFVGSLRKELTLFLSLCLTPDWDFPIFYV